MTTRSYLISAVAGLLLATSNAHAGAFGIKEGMKLSELDVVKPIDVSGPVKVYEVKAPNPNSEFESYTVALSDEQGVCKISAVGITHENDDYGSSTIPAFKSLKDILTQKYGPSKDFDFLNTGSIWDDPKDWASSIKMNERTLGSIWLGLENDDDIRAILLNVSATSMHNTYISLGYEFKNYSECKTASDAKDNSGL